jgi:peptide deformylase
MAKIIQHEYDHLNGIMFIDHALKQKSKLYEIAKDGKGKEFLREIKLI